MYPVVIVSPSPSSELDAPEQAARPSPSRPAPPASAARRLRDDVVRGWVRGVITIILHVSAVRFRFPIGHRSFVSINLGHGTARCSGDRKSVVQGPVSQSGERASTRWE